MIDWVKAHQRSATICAATLLVPVLFYLQLLTGAWAWRGEYVEAIDDMAPRIARMQGVLGVEEELASLARDASQSRDRLVYPASAERSAIAASLQSDIRQLMGEAGLSVTDSQVLPVREGAQFDYIGIKLTVSGEMESLDRALGLLTEFKPMVMVEAMDVWPSRQRPGKDEPEAQEATASLRLLALRSLI